MRNPCRSIIPITQGKVDYSYIIYGYHTLEIPCYYFKYKLSLVVNLISFELYILILLASYSV